MDKVEFRQKLINNKTPAESKLIRHLDRDPNLKGKYEFQHQIGKYFADFYFPFKKLIVELDGISHVGKSTYDRKRTKFIREQGFQVIRFHNKSVYDNIQYVISRILKSSGTNKVRKSSFLEDHINRDCYDVRGSEVVRRKSNPATKTETPTLSV